MATTATVNQFVRDALTLGRTRAEIATALREAGWSEREVEEAISEYADVEFSPPVPRPALHVTARDTFVYALLFSALAFSATFLVDLIHSILNLWLPDAADRGAYEVRVARRIRWAIAMLAISAPLFVWMTVYTRRQMAKDIGQRRSLVRKWLTYIALFVSALFLLGDGVYVIYSFLSGELTLRFALKATTVALVTGGIFVFYLRDVEAGSE